MIVSAIAAMSTNRVIGVNNDLPWNIPEDLKFFREKTMGSILIMGRKTFDSIKNPLPGRYHIVITRNPQFHYDHERVVVVTTLDEAFAVAEKMIPQYKDEVFVVGGGEIFTLALPRTDRIYLTLIHREYSGEAYFPEFENSGKFAKRHEERRSGDPAFDFQTWERV